ncbi:pyridoxal phosphate-dependent aminotransferase [Kordiimonas aquimaris]|uniref:pyridoxal phosphate-dependent aminotransferase n=1 Tax=Kordiimonas aquimaris TaxID=707591 RepID=UPI0021D365D1|nr:pyridoxal phosphate-dependent aminotransferase [Kordiimonas aquimaris]
MATPPLSADLLSLDGYATKAMAARAREIPGVVNLAFGEPAFGPPDTSKATILDQDLTWDAFYHTSKTYEQNRGMLELREGVADYYRRRYNLHVDPEREVLITHGGVEAINLAALITTEPGDRIAITDPTYMLYQRAFRTLGRQPVCLTRPEGGSEYAGMFADAKRCLSNVRSLLVNSPENPSGYVIDDDDWTAVAKAAEDNNTWVIHDEVYDSMVFDRPHIPARKNEALRDRTLMINSFSKKYGVPGLRIGWLCGPADAIDLAAKLHDYMYLGVNMLAERFALRMIMDKDADNWMDETARMLEQRSKRLQDLLTPEKGFDWPRRPHGSMFAFPNVASFGEQLAPKYRLHADGIGAAVAQYLMEECKLATIPGFVYGPSCAQSVRMITCATDETFEKGCEILAQL